MITWNKLIGDDAGDGIIKAYGEGTCLSTDEKPEDMSNGSLLIEIGTDANSIEEAEYTAALLADVLSRVL